MSKGVSAVIATILMLVITIAIAGVAYSYMSGIITSRTEVVLNIESEPYCQASGGNILVYVRNDGRGTSGTITAVDAGGNPSTISSCTPNPQTIGASAISTITCTRSAGGTGYYRIRISSPGSNTITASVYCPS